MLFYFYSLFRPRLSFRKDQGESRIQNFPFWLSWKSRVLVCVCWSVYLCSVQFFPPPTAKKYRVRSSWSDGQNTEIFLPPNNARLRLYIVHGVLNNTFLTCAYFPFVWTLSRIKRDVVSPSFQVHLLRYLSQRSKLVASRQQQFCPDERRGPFKFFHCYNGSFPAFPRNTSIQRGKTGKCRF